ncbi:hypothetical protein M0802_010698 [Mischocyttarus mexicanus]|nr:hypothetical protein M0802_010698 [Mischocyttarus mexicanus]
MISNMDYKQKPIFLSSINVLSVWILFLNYLIFTNKLIDANTEIDINCCKNDTNWLGGRNCSDGSNVNLHCSNGFFKTDPEQEEIKIIQTNKGPALTIIVDNPQEIIEERFCLISTKNEKPMALVCFEDSYIDETLSWRSVLYLILCMISAIFLIITLIIYLILPELREIQDKAMMGAVSSLAVTFLLYYAFMIAFFWLNIVAFNIWRTVWFQHFVIKDRILFPIYCVFGLFVPTCFLLSVVITHNLQGSHMKPHFGESRCWFNGSNAVWVFFYGPIAILLTLNFIYLGLTSWKLWRKYREYNGNKLRALRFKCLLYIKLVLVMGVTWIFEILSYIANSTLWYWIPTDILNSLQGLIIFLLLVVSRKKVRKLLAKKRPCGIVFPKSWIAYEDEECEDICPEELELSQQG